MANIAQTQPIKALLANGETAPALEQIAGLTASLGGDAHRAALLLRASLADVERQSGRGLLEPDQAMQQRNRITFGALRLLDELEAGSPAPETVLADLQREFSNAQTAALMPQDNDQTDLSGASIEADDGGSVIIGQGNTVHKNVFTAWGRRQFLIVLAVLALIIVGIVFGGRWFGAKQDASYASLKEIRAELAVLADLNANVRTSLEQNRAEIEGRIEKGMQALRAEDYATAIRYLESAAEEAPAGTIYQNIGRAYEQLGNAEKARENLEKAHAINPDISIAKPYSVLKGKRIDLLRPENGGKMAAASNGNMTGFTDGDPDPFVPSENSFVVFEFLDQKKATFDQVNYLVPQESNLNFTSFKLSYADDSPTGEFKPIGEFTVLNMLVAATPYQEVKFPPVTARYVKIQLVGVRYNGYAYEMQLMGKLE